MKKLFLILSLSGLAMTSMADINGDGYYRVRNYGSERWADLIDNYGSVDKYSSTADLHSLALIKDTEEILSDPGSIVYLSNISGYEYNVESQGVSLASLVDNPIKIAKETTVDGQALYRIYGTYRVNGNKVSAYIGDGNTFPDDNEGTAMIYEDQAINNAKPYVQWYFLPVSADSDNFFGPTPDVVAGDSYYTTLYASFPFQPYSTGVKAYYIGNVGFGMAEMIEINGVVPPATPVIIECAGTSPSDNKLQISSSNDAIIDNTLQGVYFDYSSYDRKNYVAYNPETMRVLGICSDGSLGFVTSSTLTSIPANTAYITVPAGSAPEFKCVNSEDYEANVPMTVPEEIFMNGEYALTLQGQFSYKGVLEIPAPEDGSDIEIQFSLSSVNEGEVVIGPYTEKENLTLTLPANLPFKYDNDAYWLLPNWKGGNLEVTLDLQYGYVSFTSDNAGVESIVASKSGLKFIGKTIYSDSAKAIKVVDMSGRTIASAVGSIDLSNLPKGIYIATSDGKSLKVVL